MRRALRFCVLSCVELNVTGASCGADTERTLLLQAHSCAVVGAGGALYCWGYNFYGQVGFAVYGGRARGVFVLCLGV